MEPLAGDTKDAHNCTIVASIRGGLTDDAMEHHLG